MDENAEALRFWDSFFGSGNLITASAIQEGHVPPSLAEYLSRLRNRLVEDGPRPLVLPRRFQDKYANWIVWYATAPSAAGWRQLGRELAAALGPTYSSFSPVRAVMDLEDPVELAVVEWAGTNTYRFSTRLDSLDSVVRALEAQERLRSVRPQRVWAQARPSGRILRDFEFALNTGDRELCEQSIAELESTATLDASNFHFLRIRMLSSFGLHADLLEMRDLDSVLQMRRPWKVTEAILQAVYEVHIAPHVEAPEPSQVVALFNDTIGQEYGSLFTTRRMPTNEMAGRLLAVAAAASSPVDIERLEALTGEPWGEATSKFLAAMSTYARSLAPADHGTSSRAPSPKEAGALLDAGRYVEALQVSLQLAADVEQASILLRCAFELDTQDAATIAIRAFDELSSAEQGSLTSTRWVCVCLESLRKRTVELPANWLDWLQSLSDDARPEAMVRLDEALATWDVNQQFSSSADAHTLASELLRTRTAEAQERVADSIPRLLEFLSGSNADPSLIHPLRMAAFDLLVVESNLREPELRAVASLVDDILSLGLGRDDYDSTVGALEAVWTEVASPSRVDWAVSVVSSLLYHSCPDDEARLRLIAHFYSSLRRMRDDVEPEQDGQLLVLARKVAPNDETWWPPRASVGERETAWLPLLQGATVGIHTLVESAARAAKDYLESASELSVVLNHDKVATQAVDTLAANSDIVIVSWGSSKHAVTERIRSQRPSEKPLLWAGGTGSSSIIRALKEFAERGQG